MTGENIITMDISPKKPAMISAMLTVVFLFIITLLSLFFEVIAMNGATEKQGTVALSISLMCNGLGIILFGFFASWLTKLFITKFKWNQILAVMISVFFGVVFGTVLSFFSMVASILLAGVR